MLPKIRAWSLVIDYSSYYGASFLACRVSSGSCVAFKIISSGVTVGFFYCIVFELESVSQFDRYCVYKFFDDAIMFVS